MIRTQESQESKTEQSKLNKSLLHSSFSSAYSYGLWYNAETNENLDQGVMSKLVKIVLLCFTFIIVESIGAYLSNSIAIFTDVIHLFSDLLGFLFSLISVHLAKQKASDFYSFGFLRAETLGALISVTIIWLMSIWIGLKSYERFVKIINHEYIELDTYYMMLTATFGLFVNITMALTLNDCSLNCLQTGGNDLEQELCEKENLVQKNNKEEVNNSNTIIKGHQDLEEQNNNSQIYKKQNSRNDFDPNKNQNIKAALAHILGDMVQSIGVVTVSTILYFKPEWLILDPLLSVSFMAISFTFSIPVIKDILRILMDSTPQHIDIKEFKSQIEKIKYVKEIHDIHMWNISYGKINFTCHIQCSKNQEYKISNLSFYNLSRNAKFKIFSKL